MFRASQTCLQLTLQHGCWSSPQPMTFLLRWRQTPKSCLPGVNLMSLRKTACCWSRQEQEKEVRIRTTKTGGLRVSETWGKKWPLKRTRVQDEGWQQTEIIKRDRTPLSTKSINVLIIFSWQSLRHKKQPRVKMLKLMNAYFSWRVLIIKRHH